MTLLIISLLIAGLPAAAAIASLLWGLTTEDWERGKRLEYCLLAIAFAAVSAAIIWFGLHGIKIATWGDLGGKAGANIALGGFIAFALVCLFAGVRRKR